MLFGNGFAPIETFFQHCTFHYGKRNLSIAESNAVSTHREVLTELVITFMSKFPCD